MRVKLLKLAKLLHTFESITTDNGILIAENEITVGTEVFIENAEGELEPAPTNEYTSKDNVYIVESGKVIEIKILNVEEPIETTETVEETTEQTEEFAEVEEIVETIETPTVEEVVEVAEEVIDERDRIIEELKAEIERLKAENEDLKKQLELPVEDAIEEQVVVYSKQDKVKRTSIEALAESLK